MPRSDITNHSHLLAKACTIKDSELVFKLQLIGSIFEERRK
jgi:hypothetical protein